MEKAKASWRNFASPAFWDFPMLARIQTVSDIHSAFATGFTYGYLLDALSVIR